MPRVLSFKEESNELRNRIERVEREFVCGDIDFGEIDLRKIAVEIVTKSW
jgi:hypothetical protein